MTLKRFWLFPMVILIIGIGISYALNSYATQYKAKDELQKELGVIEQSVDGDKDLKEDYQYDRTTTKKPPFLPQLKQDMSTAQAYIDIKNITNANKFMEKVRTNWNTWENNRFDLNNVFRQFSDLIKSMIQLEIELGIKTNDTGYKSSFISLMMKELQNKFDAIVTDTDQKQFKTTIQNEWKSYTKLQDAARSLEEMEQVCVKKDQCPDCAKIPEYWNGLKNIKDEGDLDSKFGMIKKTLEHAKSGCKDKPVTAMASAATGYKIAFPQLRKPEVAPGPERTKTWLANIRLTLYESVSFLVVVGILALYGFSQLYISNPTFGADLSDWVTLILWGLMAGTAADSITKKGMKMVGLS
jgi:hypothetical protein